MLSIEMASMLAKAMECSVMDEINFKGELTLYVLIFLRRNKIYFVIFYDLSARDDKGQLKSFCIQNKDHFNGLAQDYNDSITNTLDLLQSCIEPLILSNTFNTMAVVTWQWNHKEPEHQQPRYWPSSHGMFWPQQQNG